MLRILDRSLEKRIFGIRVQEHAHQVAGAVSILNRCSPDVSKHTLLPDFRTAARPMDPCACQM